MSDGRFIGDENALRPATSPPPPEPIKRTDRRELSPGEWSSDWWECPICHYDIDKRRVGDGGPTRAFRCDFCGYEYED